MKKTSKPSFQFSPGHFLTIDPGTKNCGWALWRASGRQPPSVEFVESGIWRANGSDPYQRAYAIAEQLWDFLTGKGAEDDPLIISSVFIERPRNFGGSTGKGAAARNASSVLKLMFLVGLLAGRSVSAGIEVGLVDVQRWKGNVKKIITARRVARAWDIDVSGMRFDETDAIGLGDFLVRKHWKVAIAV